MSHTLRKRYSTSFWPKTFSALTEGESLTQNRRTFDLFFAENSFCCVAIILIIIGDGFVCRVAPLLFTTQHQFVGEVSAFLE